MHQVEGSTSLEPVKITSYVGSQRGTGVWSWLGVTEWVRLFLPSS